MNKPKVILGIESSCDETACAVLKKEKERIHILSNIVASSASLQAKYGGVIPEQAAREQLKSITPVIQEALIQARLTRHPELVSGSNKMLKQVQHDKMEIISSIDAIAVTEGPGLIGSLLVGVETAKTLSLIWKKPLVPINHLLGHFYANWINYSSSPLRSNNNNYSSTKRSAWRSTLIPQFPCIGLLVSGGHTDLILMTGHGKYKYLGGTRDDAAGECFDKCARLLNLPYPGGPNLSKLAEKGNPKTYKLPRPMIDSKDLDFSFSGLKTAVLNIITNNSWRSRQQSKNVVQSSKRKTQNSAVMLERGEPQASRLDRRAFFCASTSQNQANLAASIEDAITDVLVEKSLRAIQIYKVDQLIVSGGVAANQILVKKLTHSMDEFCPRARIFIPPPLFCTDNAVSTAVAAFYNFKPTSPISLEANPNLSLSD